MASIVVAGDTSGTVTLAAPAVSGTTTLTLPTTSGTIVTTSGAQTIEFADGSASTPSITNSGDTNTGMFFPAADTIAFAEGGTEAMRIDSSGNVGIGTTSPTSKLYVEGTIQARLGATGIQIYGTGGSGEINSIGANPMSFNVNSTERMRIDSAGNVGIGATPSAWRSGARALQSGGNKYLSLWEQANGSVNLSFACYEGSSNVFNYTTTGDTPSLYSLVNGTHQWYTAPSGTAGNAVTFTELMRITSAGLLQFNSGYGSVATAYGCRAWVNFNGTGTVAIRASGNVTSITDNGTGDYTVNFTNAMPDANYAVTSCNDWASANSLPVNTATTPTSSAIRVTSRTAAGSAVDTAYAYVAIFR